jgi:site-specific DNA-methyltransferase (adenine-specific)
MTTAEIIHGDMLQVLPDLTACGFSCDAIITDPPYHLASIAKRFGKPGSAPAQHGRDGAAARLSRGFMGAETDAGDISFRPETWAACAGVLPLGGRMAVFGGTRTWWKTAAAIDAAGFEIEDTIMWIYGQGLVLRQSRLKPCYEPIILARKPGPVANLNIDECRIPVTDDAYAKNCSGDRGHANNRKRNLGFKAGCGSASDVGRWPGNLIYDGSPEVMEAFAAYGDRGAKAPVRGTEPSAAHSGRVYDSPKARVPGAFHSDTGSASRFFNCCPFTEEEQQERLLYHAKAPQSERVLHCAICEISIATAEKKDHQHGRPDQQHLTGHATVKPVSLMAHLVKLLVPAGGLVLDPFSGTGSTAVAALQTGRNAVGIERERRHVEGSQKRIGTVLNKAA